MNEKARFVTGYDSCRKHRSPIQTGPLSIADNASFT